MNNTALRAGALSANNTHMVFANEKHEKFYYEKLEQARFSMLSGIINQPHALKYRLKDSGLTSFSRHRSQ